MFKQTLSEFGRDNVLRLSAALAYYAMFSIGPLLVIVVGLAGFAFGNESVRHHIDQQLRSLVGEQSTQTLDSMMAAQKHGATSVITTILGIVALLFGAGGVFGQLQDALNTIWGVTSKPGQGLWGLIRKRFLSLTMVLGIGFLLLVSMALSTFLTALGSSIGNMLPMSKTLLHGLNFLLSFVVISFLFAMIFKVLPDVKYPFRQALPGAIGTALLFTIGKYLLALYLGRQSTASAYGAAGSVIIVLMWVYYGSLILFFGAEFTQVYVKSMGTVVVPTKYSVPMTREERAQQGMKPATKAPAAAAAGSAPARPAKPLTPGVFVRRRPFEFVSLMLAAGLAGGVLLRYKLLRKALKLYAAFRK